MCFLLFPQPMANPWSPRTVKVPHGWWRDRRHRQTHTRTRVCVHARVCVVLVFQPQCSRVGFLPAYHPCLISTDFNKHPCLISSCILSNLALPLCNQGPQRPQARPLRTRRLKEGLRTGEGCETTRRGRTEHRDRED